MDQDTANWIVPCLAVASIIIYPVSVKAYLMNWLDRPSIKNQTPVRAALCALTTYISFNVTSHSHHSILGYAFIIIALIFPVVVFTGISGTLGGIISEKLFPEFEANRSNHEDVSDSDDD